MPFNTRAYAKRLKKAGIKRKQAQAHVKAMNKYLRPDLATKSDLTALEQAANAELVALEQRIDQRLTWLERRPNVPIQPTQMQALGIIAAIFSVLFTLRKLTERDR